RRRWRRRAAPGDVGHLGGDGRRHAVEGAGRRADSGRDAGALQPAEPAVGVLAAYALGHGAATVPRAHRALVRRGVAAQPRLLRVLLHPRPLPALPDRRGSAARRALVLRADPAGRLPALDDDAAGARAAGRAPRRLAVVPAAAAAADLV